MLTNMADDCIPSVAMDISIESKGEKPYLRIEVPGGMNKPYCTPKGHYVTRSEGGIRPLQPNELFTMFQKKHGNPAILFTPHYSQTCLVLMLSVPKRVFQSM